MRLTKWHWGAAALVVAAAGVALSAYTSRSEYCGSCHEVMGRYYGSWKASRHGNAADCLDCHSDPGWVGYYHGKLEGVKNALSYYLGVKKAERSPPPGPAACLRSGCHTEGELPRVGSSGPFQHGTHLGTFSCIECHPGVGHEPAETERPRACSECHEGEGGSEAAAD